jgi:hypothetical protein
MVATIMALALAILVALGLPHKSQWRESIYHPLPKSTNLLRASFSTDRPKGAVPQTRSIIPRKMPPARQDIGAAIKHIGEVKDFCLSGWSIQFKKIGTGAGGSATKYEAIATQKGVEAYSYRATMEEDFPFSGRRLFVDPPMLLLICADGTEPDEGECEDQSKPESVIGR